MKTLVAVAVVACCLQLAWGQCALFDQLTYEVFEDVGLEDLALRVCLDPTEDCEVRVVTEARTATEFVDFEPVDETFQLRANVRDCLGTIIEEDTVMEGDETFDVVLLDSVGSELERATVILRDEEDIGIVYTEDTPRIIGTQVTLNFTLGRAVDSALCEIMIGQNTIISEDCTSGSLSEDLPSTRQSHDVVITTNGLGSSFTDRRTFRLGVVLCSAVLINTGLVIDGRNIEASFAGTAPAGVDTSSFGFRCVLFPVVDGNRDPSIVREDCSSPYQLTDLNPGRYIFRVVPTDPDRVCRREAPNDTEFSII